MYRLILIEKQKTFIKINHSILIHALFYVTLLILTTFFWGYLFYKKDYHPQSVKVIIQSFVMGLFSMIPIFAYKYIYENFLPFISDYAIFQPLLKYNLFISVFIFLFNISILYLILFALSAAVSVVLNFFKHTDSLWDKMAYDVVLNHHECWDGSGYPGRIDNILAPKIKFGPGKVKEEIPIFARIVSIADVYDSLISRRVYKDPWEDAQVTEYLLWQSGKQFDPELIEIFLGMLDIVQSIRKKYSY